MAINDKWERKCSIERAILSTIINDDELPEGLSEKDFGLKEHKAMFAYLKKLKQKGESATLALSGIPKGMSDEAYLNILSSTPIIDTHTYLSELERLNLFFEIKKQINEISSCIDRGELEEEALLERVQKLSSLELKSHKGIKSFDEWASELDKEEPIQKIETGVPVLDSALNGGVELGQLILLSGEADTGKTALGIQIIKHVSQTHKVLFFAFEFTVRKFITAQREIHTEDYSNPNL